MNGGALEKQVEFGFQAQFGTAPAVTSFAPGRVNLLGEHTDYNGGYVLPMALQNLGVAVAMDAGAPPAKIEIFSMTLGETAKRKVTEGPSEHWSDYVLGCVQTVAAEPSSRKGLRMVLATSLPLGAGLSSSAALEVAILRAVTSLFGIHMDASQLARAAQAVENDFVGMPCGIMDQFSVSVGTPGKALFLNTRTLEHAAAPGLAEHAFLVVDSGVSHQLTDSGYATRVAECKAACEALGVKDLSELDHGDEDRINTLPAPLNKRARHVVTDNKLTQDGFAALQAGDAATFGRLMSESHATARCNYEITVPETDALVAAAERAGALGARQTGGGWGGAIVALVPATAAEKIGAKLVAQFPKAKLLAVT
ncbi:MAG: galactokinase [Dinoroseobacter sp.]|nr:galactokinase [Dinoroseobacter sp.]